MKLVFGLILFALLCVAKGDLPKKAHPTMKVSDFICHTDGIRSSLKRYLESEHSDNPIDTTMFEQAKKLAHELDTNKTNANNKWREFETKILTGVFVTMGSLDMGKICSADPSAQLLEIISKLNFESVDLIALKNGIARFLAITTKTPVDQTLQWIVMDIKQGEEVKCKRDEVSTETVGEGVQKRSEIVDL